MCEENATTKIIENRVLFEEEGNIYSAFCEVKFITEIMLCINSTFEYSEYWHGT